MFGSENALHKQGAFNTNVRADYLVGDGFAVFDEFDVVVVEVEFDICVPEFEFIVEEFDMLDEFEVGTVVVVEDEFVTVVDVAFEFIALVFERFVLVLFAVSPPQAAPRAARPKSAESAIAFFILKTVSCLSQRLILDLPPSGGLAPKLFLFLEQTK
jgi:hypothetical protein